jgi:hypothetical protein
MSMSSTRLVAKIGGIDDGSKGLICPCLLSLDLDVWWMAARGISAHVVCETCRQN